MSKGKVYLSKSNKADYDLVAGMRKKLTDAGYEISEYRGGSYDQDKLFEGCSAIYIASHPNAYDKDGIVQLGKGILSELDTAFNKGMEQFVVTPDIKKYKIIDIVHYPDSVTRNDDKSFQYRMGEAIYKIIS
jgi:hypothetical protein